jgi:4-hydroxybenzoate polyprenyltransferase
LALLAFGLVLLTTQLTVFLSLVAVMLASAYPFMKRHTFLPQVVLGAAFAWAVPMAFAAQTGQLPSVIWLLWVAVVIWTTAYDTFYAMVDREDDLKIGVKSTAILFGDMDRVMTGVLQLMFLWAMVLVGQKFGLGRVYALGLLVAAGLLVYQQYLIRRRVPSACFAAFTNNNWVGMAIFVGIALDYALRGQVS